MQSLQKRNCLLQNIAIFCHPLWYIFPKLKKKIHVVNPCRNILPSPVEICCNFGKEIYCHPLQKYVVIPRNMLQFWQRNMLSSPAKIWCNFVKEIYCHPLQKYVAILAVADFPEGPPLDKGNFGQSDKNVFLLNRTFFHFLD